MADEIILKFNSQSTNRISQIDLDTIIISKSTIQSTETTMDNCKKWKMISDLLDISKDLNSNEIKHQDTVYNVFTNYLGWPDSAICREVRIKQGATAKRVDFVIEKEDSLRIPIEVKTSGSPDSGVEQLGSYMLHLQSEIGILIKDCFYFFYEEDYGRNIKTLDDAVLVIPFSATTFSLGDMLLKLLDYSEFNPDAIKNSLCELRRSKAAEKKKSSVKEGIKRMINSEEFVRNAIKKSLYNEGYAIEEHSKIIDELIEDIKITINFTDTVDKGFINSKSSNANVNSSGKRHRFSFDGRIHEGCSELAYSIIQKYATTSNCSIKELREILSTAGITSSVFKPDGDIKGNSRSWPDKYKMQLPGDGSVIRVYTMWNHAISNDNFSPILKFAESQGWHIEEIQ
ncbi:MAG: type I restriction enzyme HsdR N-terminal domain-containing protein [Paramuribaculum sp.]|nr:type I restriction enzyme HsdR N-terminal domain-containing protein [Paramuribaculum sp.]